MVWEGLVGRGAEAQTEAPPQPWIGWRVLGVQRLAKEAL